MVKLIAPLKSCAASGTLAGALVYSTSHGTAYAKKHFVPSDPRTQLQLRRREMFTFLSQAWGAVTDPQRLTWGQYAITHTLPTYNAFTKYNLDRWLHFKTPGVEYPPDDEYVNPRTMIMYAEGGKGFITYQLQRKVGSCPWGWCIFRAPDATYKPSLDTLVRVAADQVPAIQYVTELNVPPGDYRLMHFPFFRNGYSELNTRFTRATVT